MWPNPQETADLVTYTEEIPIGKLHFFVQRLAFTTTFPFTNYASFINNLRIIYSQII